MNRVPLGLLLAATAALAQERPLLPNAEVVAYYTRVANLMEATAAAVPGLAPAAAPLVANARQSLAAMRAASTGFEDSSLHFGFLGGLRAFLGLADALPKPHPFPAEARRQLTELRESLDRLDSHFRALLELKEAQARNPDRDNLSRYADANARLPAPPPGRQRVVFLGDSITDGWRLNEYFPDHDFVNRGIGGQITGQMLGRMKADVIDRKPAVVVVLAGTNDIARGVPLETIRSNLTMIVDLAAAGQIKPVLASVLPIHDYHKDRDPSFERTRQRPMATIRALNEWIAAFSKNRGFSYLDYFPHMVDAGGFLKPELADDGLHPNPAGYRVMAPLALEVVDKLLAPPPAPKKKRRFPF